MITINTLAAAEDAFFAGSSLCCCGVYIGIFLLALLSLAFWIWMLIDCVTKEPADDKDKTLWILILVLTFVFGAGLIGALIYYFVRRPTRIRKYGK